MESKRINNIELFSTHYYLSNSSKKQEEICSNNDFFENAYRFQVERENSTRMGKISRRPASIPMLSTNLLRVL